MNAQVIILIGNKGMSLTIPVDVEEITISTKWNGEIVVESSVDVRIVYNHKQREVA